MNQTDLLPAYQGTAVPPFTDARSAKAWLQLLPLINAPVAQAELVEALTALNGSNIPPYESLKILELFREAVHLVHHTLADRYLGRAVPFGKDEMAAWQSAMQLWSHMAQAYARCWHAALEGLSDVQEHLALLAERSLRYQCLMVREHLLAYQVVPSELWKTIFAYYRLAEARGISEKPAKDSLLKAAGVATPQSVFIHALLLAGASPYHFTARQIQWLDERLPALAPRAPLEREARALPGRGSLQIDFDEPGPPRRTEPRSDGPNVLEIDTYQLAQALSRRIKLLRNGESPDKLGLGEQFAGSVVETLLVELYRTWCEQLSDRSLPRHASTREIEVVFGLQKQHHAAGGTGNFTLPEEQLSLDQQDLVRMQLFGSSSALGGAAAQQEVVTERWQVRNESANGMQLSRPLQEGARISLQQLLAVNLGGRYFVGVIRWLQQEESHVVVGVRLMPGAPQAAAVRPVDMVNAGRRSWTECLWLPAAPSLKAHPALLLPVGWFRPGRLVEWWDGQATRKIRLESVVERGVDFERVQYAVSAPR
ncbi:hypothetical protein [Silvimonas iriomotensis]|uniref:Molecular chaperone n=1 Tax=Silvimonas iriomotensis TaxID=449662 RepID=A0ABQ2PBY3_9NEIS|nr:hypothetical protein [Silvimonas iriomotensis]GGP22779.1 hypothetical protein GCM10010970_27790 [Silvimonas iriomotensis]